MHGKPQGNILSDTRSDGGSHGSADNGARILKYSDADADKYCDAYKYPNSDKYAHSDRYAGSHGNTHKYFDSDPESVPDSDSFSDAGTKTQDSRSDPQQIPEQDVFRGVHILSGAAYRGLS